MNHAGLRTEEGRFHRGQTSLAAGRACTSSPYGSSFEQTGQYPSPHQTHHRLHSKHGSRSSKRCANMRAGGDGASNAFFGGQPTSSSSSENYRGRGERDRFLVEINNNSSSSGGQRGGGAASQLFHARRDTSSNKGGMGRGGTWLSSTSHRSTRFTSTGGRLAAIGAEPPSRSGSSDPYVGAGGPSGGNTLRGLEAGFGGGASGPSGGGGFAVSRRMTVPQRYTRSTERVVDNGGASSIGGTATSSGIAARRAGRYRGSFVGNDASAAPRKLPLIRSSGPGAKDEVGGVGKRATYPRPQQLREATGRGLVVREEGCGTCAVCTIQGSKPGNPRWENQDNYVMKEELGGGAGVRLFVVLDGHGEVGHLVSRRCAERLPKFLVECSFDVGRTTLKLSDDLRSCPVDCSSSGATCVLVTIRGDKICVANLGDSKCVLGRLVNGQMRAIPLSEDHKPDRPDERQRILEIGGQVGSRQIVVGSSPSGPIRIPMGPARVWYRCRGEIMGLAMSRSLGDDIAHRAGVSSEPEIMEHQIDASDQFLILATDGVWDVMEIGQAAEIVQGYASRTRGGKSWDPQGAATLLSHTARKRWEGLSAVIDDITAMVVRLNIC
ncbi:unnamed protein product [Ascophyllum nodosum]